MSGAEVSEAMKTILERYGFPTLCAIAFGWVLRTDILLPLVEQHSAFLQTVAESQREISEAVQEQTRLLYALKPELRQQARAQENQ